MTSSLPQGGGCFSLPRFVYVFFVLFIYFGSSFLSYICFLYFPDDFCMLLLLLSVSTVTARVPSRRFPGNGKLCTHGIIFEWPPPPLPPSTPHRTKVEIKCTQHPNEGPPPPLEGAFDWLIDWLIDRTRLANPLIGEVANETIMRLASDRMALKKTNKIKGHLYNWMYCIYLQVQQLWLPLFMHSFQSPLTAFSIYFQSCILHGVLSLSSSVRRHVELCHLSVSCVGQ